MCAFFERKINIKTVNLIPKNRKKMNDAYQKMSELMDNWLSDSSKEIKMSLIEKEILLEKMRKLYVQISVMETVEYDAPKIETEPVTSPKKEYSPAKTMEEDVDLFFDTEHESYAVVEKELKEIAEEINNAQDTSFESPKILKEQPKEAVSETDIFEQIEKTEEPIIEKEAPESMKDDVEDLFVEPDIEIQAQIDEPDISHEEDDILQFIPPKSSPAPTAPPATPTKPTPVQPEEMPESKPQQPMGQPKPAVNHKPAETQKPTEILKQPATEQPKPLQTKPQRSLNDLFNEKREDHSISSQYQHAKVGDLTKAISINDKFIYIKELFHNRGEDFSASIRQLNECQNLEEAFDCLEQMKQKFFWDTKTDAYLSFCDLLRRKYS